MGRRGILYFCRAPVLEMMDAAGDLLAIPTCPTLPQALRLKSDDKAIELRAYGGWISMYQTEVGPPAHPMNLRNVPKQHAKSWGPPPRLAILALSTGPAERAFLAELFNRWGWHAVLLATRFSRPGSLSRGIGEHELYLRCRRNIP